MNPTEHDIRCELRRIDRVARVLDARYGLPGTRLRFGLDSLVGLVPGVGDMLTLAPSAWIVWRARKMGAPGHVIGRMLANTALDFGIGAIPLIGDIFDFAFKANLRNADLLRRHLERAADASDRVPSLAEVRQIRHAAHTHTARRPRPKLLPDLDRVMGRLKAGPSPRRESRNSR